MQKSLMITLLALALTLSYQNCAGRPDFMTGTDTGNAMSPNTPSLGQTPTPNSGELLTSAEALIGALCTAEMACHHSIAAESCRLQLLSTAGLPQRFGVDPNAGFATMSQVAAGESQLVLQAAPAARASCISQISATPCSVTPLATMASPTPSAISQTALTMLSRSEACSHVY